MVLDWSGHSRKEEKQRDPWNVQGVRMAGLVEGLALGELGMGATGK